MSCYRTMFGFPDEKCAYCGQSDPSGFECCQDCADRLADERTAEEES